MSAPHRPDLTDPDETKHFLLGELLLPEGTETDRLAYKIVKAESSRFRGVSRGTQVDRRKRKAGYSSAAARRSLRQQIVAELLTQPRPKRDDEIELGEKGGGALPRLSSPKCGRFACVVLGAPASGKSSVSATIADETASVIIDADYAKRKLPEYENGLGADLVHVESAELVEGLGGLFEEVVEREYNLVHVLVGRDQKKVRQHIDDLTSLGYKVTLVGTVIEPRIAARRALERFDKDGRYVPLDYVYFDVGTKPAETLEALKGSPDLTFFGSIDTSGTIAENFWSECNGACGVTGLDCRCPTHA